MTTRRPVAEVVGPLLDSILERRPAVRIECWDSSTLEPAAVPVGTIRLRSPDALRYLLWAPGELGLARAYVAGAIDLDGDVVATVAALRQALQHRRPLTPSTARAATRAVSQLRVGGRRPPVPLVEARPKGLRHSLRRDAQAISHHYDVGNEFYELVLGPAMTYSCAYFADADVTLAEAQEAKHELVCRKLGLHERSGMRLLDVGCGWGSMALHAARQHGAQVVGITISREQARYAQQRIAQAGLADLVDIRLQDYRQLRGEQFEAISSIGMFEHVGRRRWAQYFETLRSLLAPRGRLVNHAISKVGGSRLGRRSFLHRYVFPDGELADVGDTVLAMERAGFEVRDVESLREHYAQTLRAWVANLERSWDRAVALVGPARARVWRLYMAGAVDSFERNLIAVHQVLGVATDEQGASGMPRTRASWAVPSMAPMG